jgi:hypothetical protein
MEVNAARRNCQKGYERLDTLKVCDLYPESLSQDPEH